MALPVLTLEDRAAALAKGVQVRRERAEVKASLKRGTTTLTDVLKDAATNDALAKIKVSALLESMPGVGIAESRRVRGLGANQRAALENEFAAA